MFFADIDTRDIEWEEELIRKTREELKEHILVKQEKEIRNTETYKFMHDLLGFSGFFILLDIIGCLPLLLNQLV